MGYGNLKLVIVRILYFFFSFWLTLAFNVDCPKLFLIILSLFCWFDIFVELIGSIFVVFKV